MVRMMTIDEYNRRAISALSHAQRLAGARSGNAFARLLSERGNGSPSASTYRRWIAGEAIVPAWALQVAAEVADTTLQALFDAAGGAQPASEEWQARIETAIGRLESEMIEVRQQVGLPWQTVEPETPSDDRDTVQRRSAT
jgi:hypothetical protein